MIIYFAVTNFKSFRDRIEFNMLAGNYKRLPEHVYSDFSPNLLRSAAIYGNNGAGKSNLLVALEKLQQIVLGELEVERNEDLRCFKLDERYADEPITFEIEYLIDGNRYSYYLSFVKNKIVEEWLVKVFSNNRTEEIFTRKLQNSKTFLTIGDKKKLKKSAKEQLRLEIYAEELDKKGNKPFFLDGIEKKIEIFEEPYKWFEDNLRVVRPSYFYAGKIVSFESESFSELAKTLIRSLELGIEDLRIESIPLEDFFGKGDESTLEEIKSQLDKENFPIMIKRGLIEYSLYKNHENKYVASKLITIHKNNVEFELYEESTGTQKIIELLPSIVGAVVDEKVYLFDEIETSKHPEVIKELISLYLSAGSKFCGQLIFTTHECNLLDLDLLRQDEIWFAEKDLDGVSHIYSLSDFKPRYDKDIRKGYLEGQFTTIPFFTNPINLNWDKYDEKR